MFFFYKFFRQKCARIRDVYDSGRKVARSKENNNKKCKLYDFFYLFSNFEKSTNDHERIAFNKFNCRSESTIICWIFDNKTILIETWKKYRKNYFKKMLKF